MAEELKHRALIRGHAEESFETDQVADQDDDQSDDGDGLIQLAEVYDSPNRQGSN